MRLDDFENEISPVIFRRGDDYYEDGLVEELEETAPGTWCAVVAGTMDYETEVRIKDGEIVSWDCDCPYDGYMCKHVVAVLLKLRNERPSFAEYEEVEFGDEPVMPEERTVMSFEGDEDLSNKISLLTYRQLRDFVGRYAQKDAAFREELLGTVVEKQLSGTPDTYRREVRKHICYANIYGILEKGQLLLEALMQYSEVLKDMYSKQLLAMFVPLIQDYAEKNVNVKAYPYVVQVLRQMRRLNGGPEAVSGLIALFRQKYIRRPRMMQELDKL